MLHGLNILRVAPVEFIREALVLLPPLVVLLFQVLRVVVYSEWGRVILGVGSSHTFCAWLALATEVNTENTFH